MRTIFFSCLLNTLLFASAVLAGGNFEGSIVMTSRQMKEGADEAYENKITMAVKNDKIAVNMPGSPARIVIDAATGDLYSVIDRNGQQMVMKMKLQVLSKMGGISAMSGMSNGFTEKEAGDAKVVTESATLKGYNCKKYTITDSDSKTEVWVAQNFPYDFSKITSMLDFKTTWYKENAGPNVMPIMGISKNLKTNELSTFDVDVKPSAVDASKFEIPANAMVMDVSQMMEQMIQSSDPEAMKKMFQQMIPPAPTGK